MSLRRSRFVITMMPTGSGKTIVEMSLAKHFLSLGCKILVLEPTRFLVDQMRLKWQREFRGTLSRNYEGECGFEEKSVYLSTPRTALKCLNEWPDFNVVIVDEFHRALGSSRYTALLEELAGPTTILLGFTALAPSSKLRSVSQKLIGRLGEPVVLKYDFKTLEAYGDYKPPTAIADVYESELDDEEKRFYNRLIAGPATWDPWAKRIYSIAKTLFYKYGWSVACEFLEKHGLLKELASYCYSGYRESHKLRILDEILLTYDVSDVSPVIIFAWSKSFVKEIVERLKAKHCGLGEEILWVTGDTSRRERLRILEELHTGEVKFIVSSSVGEEGFDLPDAGLLVLIDVPRSETRFYQRLGRLLRRNPRHKVKYLAIISTPETPEHTILPDVLQRLYMEGVDVSYVVTGLEEFLSRTPAKAIADVVREYCIDAGSYSIPYLSLRWGWGVRRIRDTIQAFLENNPELQAEIECIAKELTLPVSLQAESPVETLLNFYASIKILSLWCPEKFGLEEAYKKHEMHRSEIRELMKKLDGMVSRDKYYKYLREAVGRGELYIAPDPDLLSDLLLPVFKLAAEEWSREKKPRPPVFMLNNKFMILLSSNVIPECRVHDYMRVLEDELQNYDINAESICKPVWVRCVKECSGKRLGRESVKCQLRIEASTDYEREYLKKLFGEKINALSNTRLFIDYISPLCSCSGGDYDIKLLQLGLKLAGYLLLEKLIADYINW